MKRALIAVTLVGVLATGTLFFLQRRNAAPPPPVAATAPATAAAPAKPEVPASGNPVPGDLGDLECLLSSPPTCPVKGKAASLGAEGTRAILKALASQVTGCRAGKSADCVLVGQAYEEGTVVDARPEKAASLYEQACDQGVGDGCQALRSLYRQGKGVLPDESRAKALLQKALVAWRKGCSEGRNSDCGTLEVRPPVDEVTDEDRALARTSTEKSCQQGDKAACSSLAGDLAFSSEKDGGIRALALYERACDEKNTFACERMVFLLKYGSSGVPRDEARATALDSRVRSWLLARCDADDLEACEDLGGMDANGKPEAHARGAKHLRKACDAGRGFACYTLANSLPKKEDLQSEAERVLLYERGCLLGAPAACEEVAKAHEHGTGVPADTARALEAYAHQCWLGDGAGCWEEARLVGAKDSGPKTSERVTLALRRARANNEESCMPSALPVECKLAGDLYDGRAGLDADPRKREALYTASVPGLESDCSMTEERACMELADLYAQGLGGLTRDENKASELRHTACVARGDCKEDTEEEPEHSDADHESEESESAADSE
jgi:hypothetical protein